ncbi:MAG TPA: response regulator [Candidatus Levybacteria bacterium]|nr:response regulator [Candidatus Levybacteria bacterium]
MEGQPTNEQEQEVLLHLLVAEDDKLLQALLQMALKTRLQVHVDFVSNGQEALEKLQEDPSINALMTDRDMPGVNGIDLIRQVRVQHEKMPITLASGNSLETKDLENEMQELKVSIMPKPYTPTNLQEMVQDYRKMLNPSKSQ